MRVLICGGREWSKPEPIKRELLKLADETGWNEATNIVVIHGAARGADSLADKIASDELGLMTVRFPAHWQHDENCQPDCDRTTGKVAGRIRNQQMLTAGQPDLVLAFHENLEESKGTLDMIFRASRAGVPVRLFSR